LKTADRRPQTGAPNPAAQAAAVRRPSSAVAIPSAIPQYYLPAQSLEDAVAAWRAATGNRRARFGEAVELAYRPALLAQAVVRYASTKAQLNTDRRFACLVPDPSPDFAPHWRENETAAFAPDSLSRTVPRSVVRRGVVPIALTNVKKLAAWQKDFVAYLYRTADFTLHHNPALKLVSRPGQSYAEFLAECQRVADARMHEEVEAIRARFDRQLDRLEDRLIASQRDLKEDQEQLRAREAENRWTGIENLVGFMLGRTPYRPMSTSTMRERLVKKTRSEVEQGVETIERLQAQIDGLKREAQALFQASQSKWAGVAQNIQELRITPRRSDILVELFGVGWMPYWQIEVDGVETEIAACGNPASG